MTHDIREVSVEFLRRGPRHNQLLSPLTDYLGVCGNFPVSVVHAPYEHSEAQGVLDDLRYTVASANGSDRLADVRERAGAELARMLTAVEGLPGVLAGEQSNTSSLTHLRLVLSSAELALLPFELSKVPVGGGSVGDDWLGIQPDRPVCITRHIRGVAASGGWPTKPRILFVSGDDVPFAEHLDVFQRVLEPWRRDELRQDPAEPRRWTSEHLTVIERATLDELQAEVAREAFSHVHILAHGAEIEGRRSGYGIALGDRIVTGGALALALGSSLEHHHDRPSVVTLASCDSAAQGSVIAPGGSVAHELHASGIPLVVASQFPISQAASVPFTETFYSGQMCGEHPFVSLTEARRLLANRFPDEHAWASLVVYEALPPDFADRLDELHYWQSRRAHETALVRLESVVTTHDERIATLERSGQPFPDDFESPDDGHLVGLQARITELADLLPTRGPYASECDGLRAAGAKRTAEVAYWLSLAPDAPPEIRHRSFERCITELDVALDLYRDAVRALLATDDGTPRRKVTTHWIVGQVLLLEAILGHAADTDLLGVARSTMRFDLDHQDAGVRAWATVSSVEQAILDLAIDGPSDDVARRALRCADELARSLDDDAEQIHTTWRQMRRFVSWWGDPHFVTMMRTFGVERTVAWHGEHGVVATASAVADVLEPSQRSRPRRVAPTPPTTPVVTSPGGSLSRPAEIDTERVGVFDIEMLPARNGDCLWVTYGPAERPAHFLIDCGSVSAAPVAAERVNAAGNVELFVLTHIDADHISGAIPLFEDAETAGRFEDVWFNGWNQLRGFLSVAQGEAYSALLEREDRPFTWNRTSPADDPPPPIVTDGEAHPTAELPGGMRLTVLSPTTAGLTKLARHWHAALRDLDPERAMLGRRARPSPPDDPASLDLEALAASGPTRDTSVPNLSSIALLAEFGGRAVLFTGDAHADVLTASIRALQTARGRGTERLRLDALKLSHHGSANATTRELLDTIDCRNYLVPTDGSYFYHPDREAIARVIVHGGADPVLHFNHRTDFNAFWADAELQRRYGYTTVHPSDEVDAGVTVVL